MLRVGADLAATGRRQVARGQGRSYERRWRIGDQACGQHQAFADAAAQLLRGGFGEGHRQDLADAQAALDHQPREQRR